MTPFYDKDPHASWHFTANSLTRLHLIYPAPQLHREDLMKHRGNSDSRHWLCFVQFLLAGTKWEVLECLPLCDTCYKYRTTRLPCLFLIALPCTSQSQTSRGKEPIRQMAVPAPTAVGHPSLLRKKERKKEKKQVRENVAWTPKGRSLWQRG